MRKIFRINKHLTNMQFTTISPLLFTFCTLYVHTQNSRRSPSSQLTRISNVWDISNLCGVSERKHVHFRAISSPLITCFVARRKPRRIFKFCCLFCLLMSCRVASLCHWSLVTIELFEKRSRCGDGVSVVHEMTVPRRVELI